MPTEQKFLTINGLHHFLQKIKTTFSTKTEIASAVNDLASPSGEAGQTLVHRTGDETIAGTKTFSSTINGTADKALKDGSGNTITSSYLPISGGTLTGALGNKVATVERGVTTTKVDRPLIEVKDKNGTRFALLECNIAADKTVKTALYAYNTTATSGNNIGSISIGCDTNGTVVTSAPTPADAADNSTKIATTAWVTTKCGNYVPLTGGTMTGSLTMTGNSKSFIVKNDTYTLSLQVGSGGINRGLWDTTLNKWIVYADASAAYLNGNAATATKLQTARTINGVSFDGSANITVADSTKMPLAGGALTGSLRCTAKYTSADTTYTSDILTFNSGNNSYGNNVALGGGGNTIIGGGESYSAQLSALAGNGSEACYVCADNAVYIKSNCNTFANAKTTTQGTDGKLSCPSGFVGTISSSSDARLKTFKDISEETYNAWNQMKWVEFKYNADKTKTHYGMIAQDINAELEKASIDPSSLGITEMNVNYDEATMKEFPQIWTVNYIDALCLEAAYQRRRADAFEERLKALEETLANIVKNR